MLSKYNISSYKNYKLKSQYYEQRIYQRAIIRIEEKEVDFYNTYLSYENYSLRKIHMNVLKNILDRDRYKYKILIGDFNVDKKDELDLFLDSYLNVNKNKNLWYRTYI